MGAERIPRLAHVHEGPASSTRRPGLCFRGDNGTRLPPGAVVNSAHCSYSSVEHETWQSATIQLAMLQVAVAHPSLPAALLAFH
jgi:hypothetical protein